MKREDSYFPLRKNQSVFFKIGKPQLQYMWKDGSEGRRHALPSFPAIKKINTNQNCTCWKSEIKRNQGEKELAFQMNGLVLPNEAKNMCAHFL